MTERTERLHLEISASSHRELGRRRGEALSGTLSEAYAKYAELFRVLGVDREREEEGVAAVVATLSDWRPEVLAELDGIAEGAGLQLAQVVALNARTEIIALGALASSECSTVTAEVDGRRLGAQTWDWHIELAAYWHTQIVDGPGYRFAGLTEQGILSKIGVNEAGLALHFNILGHRADGPTGVPMHVLSNIVLTECGSVDEAVALIRSAPVSSSSAFTLLDSTRAVSVEMSPAGVFVIPEVDGSVQRTNHFQDEVPLAAQKSEIYEPDSSERLALLRSRVATGVPGDSAGLVALLATGAGEAPLTCFADRSKSYGERWETLATVTTDPQERTLGVLDGKPTEAASGNWRVLTA